LNFDIHISVDSNSAGGAWEPYLAMADPNARFVDLPWRFSRTVSRRTVSAQPDWPGDVRVTIWMYSGLGVERAAVTWNLTWIEGSGKRRRNRATQILTRASDYDQVQFQTGVVQIFGLPLERASDVFLSVGGVDRGDVPYWISPADIQRRYPNVRLLIVEAPPAQIGERSPTDRLQAAQLKRFGALAFQSGIPAVLVLPSLPPDLVNGVMKSIFKLLERNTGNASRGLARLTRRLQEMAGAYPHDSADVPLELAFDICLYVEDRVNFRSRVTPA
jgi:hypothetical protein